VFGRQVRVPLDHFGACPPTKGLDCVGRGTRLHMDGTDLEELNMLNEKKFTLDEVLGDSLREFTYEYDFGDSWRHHITVTPIAKPRTDWSYPLCVAGVM
jgi:hypothetical protein